MRASDYPYCASKFAAMAHRGGGGWEPNLGKENTAGAFMRAVELGYRYLEIDLRASRDGALVCLHDADLDRLAGIPALVAELTSVELSQVRIGGSEPVAFFDDIADALPAIRFNLDLKSADAVEPLVEAIAAHRIEDRILVNSFSQRCLSRFRALTHGSIPTGMAPPAVLLTVVSPIIASVISSPAVACQVPVSRRIGPVTLALVNRETIARVHDLGKVIHVWTIDDPEEMARLIDLGVDGIITDRPDLLRDILIERDLWEGT